MKKHTDKYCPVCHMDVVSDTLSHDYTGMHFVFCSQQCKDRFTANPHLYIGKPGMPSPKQQGKQVIKKRTLKLERVIPEDVSSNIIQALNAMMGIKQVRIEGDRIDITYDLLEATVQQIEATLEDTGNRLASSWGKSLKRAFVHYLEETEIDALESSGGQHCHH